MTRLLLLLIVAAAVAACDRGSGSAPPPQPAGTGSAAASPAGQTLGDEWQEPGSGRIGVRRLREYDLTGDGEAEQVVVTAQGAAYDSLEIALAIRTERGDTLWLERWPSALYFKYDPLEGKADTTVARIVRTHVDSLVHESRFSARGLPPQLRRADFGATVDESVQYHLAEIDYRGRANLEPRDPTPHDSYDRITAAQVGPDRVRVVRQELEAGPTFMYYAGGEATYAIGWSVREQSFVRLFSCC